VCVLLSDSARRRPRSADRVWLGSGLFLCGKCLDGTTMLSAIATGGGNGPRRPAYRCRAGAHLGRAAETVDKYITGTVLEWLKLPGAQSLLRAESGIDTESLSAEATALRVRLDELTSLFAGGKVTARQLAEGSAEIRQRLADVEVKLATAVTGSPLEGLVDADDVDAAWGEMSVSRKKAVINELMVVTLLPAPRGRRPGGGYFDPASVDIQWRQ
jgi:site-specific DNA recombinase